MEGSLHQAELIVAEEEECRRIAVEIHDRIGQNLAISKIKPGMALQATPPGDLTDLLSVTRDLIGQTIEDTRSLASVREGIIAIDS